MKTLFIDFDGTICPNKEKKTDWYPPPTAECISTLKALKEAGHEIIIYSVRSNPDETSKEDGHEKMLKYLKKHKIPYDDTNTSKPHFTMVIDDKCCGIPLDNNKNIDWTKVNSLLYNRGYVNNKT